MKKFYFLTTLLICGLFLTGCSTCKVDESGVTKVSNEYSEFCLSNGGTYSRITSQDEEYGECLFPSGVGCRDDILLTDECYFKPNLDDIDTEEERRSGCEDNINTWLIDMLSGSQLLEVDRSDDENQVKDDLGNLTVIQRDFVVNYSHDGHQWRMPGLCEANFIEGSLSTIYDQEVLDE